METVGNLDSVNELDIAVIGMSGRFPGAKNIEQFWENLKNGVESITNFSERELENSDVDPALLRDPNYVKAAPMLEDIESFDASFFGYNPREAEQMDPQSRIFLECVWEALENAGYNPKNYDGSIGLYAGQSLSTYMLRNAYPKFDFRNSILTANNLQNLILNEREFLPTRVSYKLNLKGPSINVQTACSSSLVSIHLARQSLLVGECDIAIAGGISIYLPQKTGYLYEEGMILSPDGHCRTFDAKAKGTLFGGGVGVVVLKPLVNALADGDRIDAVIKGSAINNDGALKVGFTAPSVGGQAEVVAEALANADIEAETIGYVEAHGTATPQGDPIEVAGLTQAFSHHTQKKGFCAIGSVKTNIGHLDVAAGVTSFIKTVLMLKHKSLVPSLHFDQPNPEIDFANSPFYVNTKLQAWEINGTPRRAGVSAFGIGGTNAHMILEEPPVLESIQPEIERPLQVLSLSAKSQKALRELAGRYETHLKSNPSQSLVDICFTANLGREHFNHRLALIGNSKTQICEQIAAFAAGYEPDGVLTGQQGKSKPKIAFLFAGQGSQYIGMGRELYETQPTFRDVLDRCDELLRPYMDRSLLSVLYPEDGETSPINETAYTQPALFAMGYALTELWRSWGIEPDIVTGHSLGEYVAACVAGVLSLEDALKLVARRGQLMQSLPPGGEMVAVFADEECVGEAIAPYRASVAIAALNGPTETVISGTPDAVRAVLETLEPEGLQTRRLTVSHAFHSPLMEPILDAFEQIAAEVTYSAPQIGTISNITGQLANASEIATPGYWRRHLRETVRFSDAIAALAEQDVNLCIEIGAHPKLSVMGRRCNPVGVDAWLPSLRKGRSDWQQLLTSLGTLYTYGADIDWAGFDRDYPRYRLPLPTYPFQRQRYWIDAVPATPGSQRNYRRNELDDVRKLPRIACTLPEKEAMAVTKKQSFRNRVLAVPPAKRFSLLRSYLCQQLVKITGVSVSNLDVQEPLRNIGFDSLMVVELKNQISADLRINLPVQELIAGASVVQLADKLNQKLTADSLESPMLQGPVIPNAPAKLAPVTDDRQQLTPSPDWTPVKVMGSQNTTWIALDRSNPQTKVRLFCFPYAGAGASIFRSWQNHLPPEIEVVSVQLPGREERIGEQPFTELASLVETLAKVLLPALDKPFAFYGHSFGGLLGFELARYLRTRHGKNPIHLFVGACTAPQLPNPFQFLDSSSDSALIELLHEFGTPAELLENTELMEALLPTIKADFLAFNGYTYWQEVPLDCPITAFGGLKDTKVNPEAIAPWYEQADSPFNLQIVPGKHLFLESDRELLLQTISYHLMQSRLPKQNQPSTLLVQPQSIDR